jgi:hypothetical protein
MLHAPAIKMMQFHAAPIAQHGYIEGKIFVKTANNNKFSQV